MKLRASDLVIWVGVAALIAAGIAVSGLLALIWPGLEVQTPTPSRGADGPSLSSALAFLGIASAR